VARVNQQADVQFIMMLQPFFHQTRVTSFLPRRSGGCGAPCRASAGEVAYPSAVRASLTPPPRPPAWNRALTTQGLTQAFGPLTRRRCCSRRLSGTGTLNFLKMLLPGTHEYSSERLLFCSFVYSYVRMYTCYQ
jgi:hypothetical protein